MKLRQIVIYRPNDMCIFETGSLMKENGEKSNKMVLSINLSLFGTVTIKLSNGSVYVYKGLPVSYEK
jgi:hypothetical protein